MTTRHVAIYIFDEVEVLDFCGPFEVFSVAGRGDPAPFVVSTVARDAKPISTRGGMLVTPKYTFEDLPAPDILLVPGGWGTRALVNNSEAIDWIRRTAEHTELVSSVCTGALLLAKAGLLEGQEATTHYLSIDQLRKLAPGTKVHTDRRFVDNGRVVTSAGVSAGLDMALHIVARLAGEELARSTAQLMEYDYKSAATGKS